MGKATSSHFYSTALQQFGHCDRGRKSLMLRLLSRISKGFVLGHGSWVRWSFGLADEVTSLSPWKQSRSKVTPANFSTWPKLNCAVSPVKLSNPPADTPFRTRSNFALKSYLILSAGTRSDSGYAAFLCSLESFLAFLIFQDVCICVCYCIDRANKSDDPLVLGSCSFHAFGHWHYYCQWPFES